MVVPLLGILVASEMAQSWIAWQHESGRLGGITAVSRNSLCAVTIVGGQVYYGTVLEVRDGYLRLGDVYYVQNVAVPNGRELQARLVSRHKNDWHGPDWMAIPADKIVLVENVGKPSRLARLIAQDRGSAPATAVP